MTRTPTRLELPEWVLWPLVASEAMHLNPVSLADGARRRDAIGRVRFAARRQATRVMDVHTNIAAHKVEVEHRLGEAGSGPLRDAIEHAGYDVAAVAADVGIAMGAGAHVAIEAADVTLVRGELTGVVEAMRLSKATFRKIVENLIWASGYNIAIAAIPIAAAGPLHPMIGVTAMTVSSLSVIGNSILLKRTRLTV